MVEWEANEMVELTVLGNYGAYAPANGACSGYLLEINGYQILLECGNGAFSKALKYTDASKLGMVIISHLHHDHYSDLYCLRQALKYQMQEGLRTEPVILYLPEEPEELLAPFKNWDDVFMIVNLAEAKTVVNDYNLFQLAFFPVKHQIPTYGMQLYTGGEKVLVYTADTAWFPQLETSCKGSRYLLAEASLKEYELEACGNTHMTARQAAMLAQNSGVENLILTHFFPEHNQHQLRREAEAHYDGKLHMSATGKKYTLQP